jgi:hypothetical protein
VRVYRTIPLHFPKGKEDKGGKKWRGDLNYSVRTKSDINIDALPTKEGPYYGVVLFRPWDERFRNMKTGTYVVRLFFFPFFFFSPLFFCSIFDPTFALICITIMILFLAYVPFKNSSILRITLISSQFSIRLLLGADAKAFFDEVLPMFSTIVRDSDLERFAKQKDSKLPRFQYVGPILHRGKTTCLIGMSLSFLFLFCDLDTFSHVVYFVLFYFICSVIYLFIDSLSFLYR